MKVTYNTLVEAIQDLQKQGYTEDYNLCQVLSIRKENMYTKLPI